MNGQRRRSAIRIVGFMFPLIMLGLLVGSVVAGCNFTQTSEQAALATQMRETEIELNVRQTLMAMPGSQAATNTPESNAPPPAIASTPTVDTQLAAQQTVQAAVATQSAMQTVNPAQPVAQTPVITPSPDMAALMKTANILLYEDMIGNLDTNRYVKDTLDKMGLPYTDVGSAKGWLKSNLLSNAPNGKPWDLIIIAAEAKGGISGEFFEYVTTALDQGASVILEVWYLDRTFNGTAGPLLNRCGITFDLNWKDIPPARMVLFPLDYAHPVLNQPNSGLSFTNTTSYWWDPTGKKVYDIGDLMKITGGGNGQMLLGTMASEKTSHGTLTVCEGGRLTLQTFSSHQFAFDTMRPLWENYIYNALKARFGG